MAASRFPSLDLLRSYAIASVVLAHTTLAFGVGPSLTPLQLGGTGVDLFFLLSGWLLGSQLMRELKSTGTIKLGVFWSRRWLRTLPAYYAVLAATYAQQLVNGNRDLDFSFLWFGQNYVGDASYFAVSWSLCVEEHFYLVIGPLLLALAARGRHGIPIAAVVLCIPFVCRTMGWYHSLEATHVRFDECLTGVALAGVSVFLPRLWATLCRWAPWIATAGGATFAWFAFSRWHPQYRIPIDEPTLCIWMFGSVLLLAVSNDWWRQHLSVPGAAFLAQRAYSVYLLHPDALALLKRLDIDSFAVFFVLTWVLTLLAAEVLYRWIEKPLMDARERYRFSAHPAHSA